MVKSKVILSVDPGVTGYFCLLKPDTKDIAFFSNAEDELAFLHWFNRIKETYDLRAIAVEEVHAVAGSSAGASFKFGQNYGKVLTLAHTLGVSVYSVQPKLWQKTLGLHVKKTLKGARRKTAIKKEVARLILNIYPEAKGLVYGKRGGLHDGKTDSLAIAHWLWHTHNL
jgi:hypothetical protein